ncbi:galactose mutarotase-like protein [Pterulicium gracile]|uniref:Galactose mutarotase-like protein n=1 Tax=Pterulicium gracile TaxID=1884261 RepID=A0A5C3QKQ2_9AGAR|nr:galactose mutarotase-like protein [Pterula gracilis]
MASFTPILLSLPSLTPSVAVEILPHGLTINRIYVQAEGRTHDLVLGPESPQDHLGQKYVNTIIGRYSNRIPTGEHVIERNGVTAKLTSLPNESPQVSLHGGPTGFDSLPWEQVSSKSDMTLFTNAELDHLHTTSTALFRLVSPDGDQGFPGALLIETLVTLVAPVEQERHYVKPGDTVEPVEYELGSVVIVYRAKLQTENTVTPVNLTQHWGFNLDASLKKDDASTVKAHNLSIKSDRIVKRDAHSLATGFTPTKDDEAHTHNGKLIGDKFPVDANGYDDFYVFSDNPPAQIPKRFASSKLSADSEHDLVKDIVEPAGTPRQPNGQRADSVVELSSKASGLKLLFDTNQSGVMFYTNNWANKDGARKKIHGGTGIKGTGNGYVPGSAAFLEFHDPLAAFLDPANKNDDDTLITSDEIYHNYVRMDIRYTEGKKSTAE